MKYIKKKRYVGYNAYWDIFDEDGKIVDGSYSEPSVDKIIMELNKPEIQYELWSDYGIIGIVDTYKEAEENLKWLSNSTSKKCHIRISKVPEEVKKEKMYTKIEVENILYQYSNFHTGPGREYYEKFIKENL